MVRAWNDRTHSAEGRGISHPYEIVAVVEAPRDVRIERLVERGLSTDDAEARMASQATDAARRALADHVIDNRGDVEQLTEAVTQLWHRLQRHHQR